MVEYGVVVVFDHGREGLGLHHARQESETADENGEVVLRVEVPASAESLLKAATNSQWMSSRPRIYEGRIERVGRFQLNCAPALGPGLDACQTWLPEIGFVQ